MRKYRIIGIVVILSMIMSLVSFAEEQDSYTIMIFLNGSDLESGYDPESNALAGNATDDLNEMIAGYSSTSGVNVIVQTGGTLKWANDYVDPSLTQRFELVDGAFVEKESLPPQNIGYKKTLSDFIKWGARNYPADKYALILWNHGAGPVGGYGVDELSDYDSLGLEELRGALESAKEKTNITFDLIGFDACLMASVEVADTVKDFAKYLVASEEIEPGHGWNYKAILTALNMNPKMDGATLGKLIASSYLSHAKDNGSESDVTMSVIDLSKIGPVVSALEALVEEADEMLLDNMFFYEFARSALSAKSFGGNTEFQGFTDLVDIGDFANGLSENQELKSAALTEAVTNAVIYKVDGPYAFNTSGLSVYFPYRDKEYYAENIATYSKTGFSPTYQEFLKSFKATMDKHEANGPISYVLNDPTEEYPYYELVIEQNDLEKVYYVYIDLYTEPMFDVGDRFDIQYLGYDFLVYFDEESQSYFDDFTFGWTFIGDEPLMMFVTQEIGNIVEYESPVLYNGEYMNLIYSWVTEYSDSGEDLSHYEVHGLRRMINPETGMPDKNLYQLEVGSIINPIYSFYDFETDLEIEAEGNPVTVTPDTDVEFKELGGTNYALQFRVTDFAFNHHLTDLVFFSGE